MTYPTQNCVKCGKQSMDDIDHITFFVASRCRTCFSAYLEYLRLSSPTDVCLSTYLNKQYCDLLLPYLDQQRKKARDVKRREQQQLQQLLPGGHNGRIARRRLEF
ncbi:MAG: hypothetical protein WD512_03755 [Candidatus Paceibacterota bacterium]